MPEDTPKTEQVSEPAKAAPQAAEGPAPEKQAPQHEAPVPEPNAAPSAPPAQLDISAVAREIAEARMRAQAAEVSAEATRHELKEAAKRHEATKAVAERYRQFALAAVKARLEQAPAFVKANIAVADESDPLEIAEKIEGLMRLYEAAKAEITQTQQAPAKIRRLPTID